MANKTLPILDAVLFHSQQQVDDMFEGILRVETPWMMCKLMVSKAIPKDEVWFLGEDGRPFKIYKIKLGANDGK